MESIAEALKKARKGKGLSLEEIAKETNINKKYLKALEEGNYDLFPGEAYVKGFLRNYASFLGLAAEELVKGYSLKKSSPVTPPAPSRKRSKKKDRRVLYYLLLCAMVVLLIFLIWRVIRPNLRQYLSLQEPERAAPAGLSRPPEAEIEASRERKEEGEEKPEGEPEEEEELIEEEEDAEEDDEEDKKEEQLEEETLGPERKEIFPFSRFPLGERKLILRGAVAEETWVEVGIDGVDFEKGILEKGEERVWRAREEIKIKIGNAGGIELFLNERTVGELGKRGEVVTKNFTLEDLPGEE